MADELKFDESLRSDYPDRVVEYLPNARSEAQSKAKYMCDRNFEVLQEQERETFLKSAAIVTTSCDNDDIKVLMSQDPYIVFWSVYATGKLYKVRSHENEALEKTAIWFAKNFAEKFNLNKQDKRETLMDYLVGYINPYLWQRLRDVRRRNRGEDGNFYYHDRQVTNPNTGEPETQRVRRNIGEGVIINDNGEEATLLDLIDENNQINLPKSRSAIHRSLADKPTKAVYADVMQVIKEDPEGKLREMCLNNNPAINAYVILNRLHINDERQSAISESLGVPNASVNSLLDRHAYPYLGQVVLKHIEGYEPETLRQAIEADSDGILTRPLACMRDPRNNIYHQAHVQYLAKQFCSCFDTTVRSIEEVTRELVEKYGYNITVEMVKEFWRTTGVITVTKAVRLFNVKKHDS